MITSFESTQFVAFDIHRVRLTTGKIQNVGCEIVNGKEAVYFMGNHFF